MRIVVEHCENTNDNPINDIVKISKVSSVNKITDKSESYLRIYCLKHETDLTKVQIIFDMYKNTKIEFLKTDIEMSKEYIIIAY